MRAPAHENRNLGSGKIRLVRLDAADFAKGPPERPRENGFHDVVIEGPGSAKCGFFSQFDQLQRDGDLSPAEDAPGALMDTVGTSYGIVSLEDARGESRYLPDEGLGYLIGLAFDEKQD